MKPQYSSAEMVIQADTPQSTTLRGRCLMLVRAGWGAIALLTVGAFIAALPYTFTLLRTVCVAGVDYCAFGRLNPETVSMLQVAGVSMHMYAVGYLAFQVVITCIWWAIAAIIVWRKSDDWMALLVALMLVLQGTGVVTEMLGVAASQGFFVSLLALKWLTLYFVFYLFPDGRFVPRWMRWFAIGFTILLVLFNFFPKVLPIWLDPSPPHFLWFVFICSILFAQVYRYRRVSGPVQRQQTKWAVFGMTTYLLGGLVLAMSSIAFPALITSLVLNIAIPVLQLLIPLSIGMAILRSRLWDIDVIIRRTLIYGTLTAILVLLYFASVIGLQRVLGPLIGPDSEVAIIASTLAIAALFNPLRRRIQAFIDRRFYRRKYDAAQVLAAFAATARDEVDLDQLTAELVHVVQETLQPAQVSIWLREPKENK
jgi:hypothetical protein